MKTQTLWLGATYAALLFSCKHNISELTPKKHAVAHKMEQRSIAGASTLYISRPGSGHGPSNSTLSICKKNGSSCQIMSTDEAGIYLYWLEPGDYQVAVQSCENPNNPQSCTTAQELSGSIPKEGEEKQHERLRDLRGIEEQLLGLVARDRSCGKDLGSAASIHALALSEQKSSFSDVKDMDLLFLERLYRFMSESKVPREYHFILGNYLLPELLASQDLVVKEMHKRGLKQTPARSTSASLALTVSKTTIYDLPHIHLDSSMRDWIDADLDLDDFDQNTIEAVAFSQRHNIAKLQEILLKDKNIWIIDEWAFFIESNYRTFKGNDGTDIIPPKTYPEFLGWKDERKRDLLEQGFNPLGENFSKKTVKHLNQVFPESIIPPFNKLSDEQLTALASYGATALLFAKKEVSFSNLVPTFRIVDGMTSLDKRMLDLHPSSQLAQDFGIYMGRELQIKDWANWMHANSPERPIAVIMGAAHSMEQHFPAERFNFRSVVTYSFLAEHQARILSGFPARLSRGLSRLGGPEPYSRNYLLDQLIKAMRRAKELDQETKMKEQGRHSKTWLIDNTPRDKMSAFMEELEKFRPLLNKSLPNSLRLSSSCLQKLSTNPVSVLIVKWRAKMEEIFYAGTSPRSRNPKK